MNKMYYPVVALALGHLVTDMQAGALPIVLPQLKELFSLSYSQLAAIVLLQNIMSSVIQPAFGYLTDRRSLPRFLPLCAALAGAGFEIGAEGVAHAGNEKLDRRLCDDGAVNDDCFWVFWIEEVAVEGLVVVVDD